MGTPALPRRPEMHTCLLQAAAPQGAMEHVRMPDGLAMGRLHETVGHRAMGRARALRSAGQIVLPSNCIAACIPGRERMYVVFALLLCFAC